MAAAAISGIIPRDFPKFSCLPVGLVIHYITTTKDTDGAPGCEREANAKPGGGMG